jgi:hypothetical protein
MNTFFGEMIEEVRSCIPACTADVSRLSMAVMSPVVASLCTVATVTIQELVEQLVCLRQIGHAHVQSQREKEKEKEKERGKERETAKMTARVLRAS